MSTRTDRCRICDHSGTAEEFVAQEKMFGLGDSFGYFRCARCGCLQIADPHVEMARYYPERYYSFSAATQRLSSVSRLMQWRNAYAVFSKGVIGRLLVAVKPHPPLQSLALVPMRRDWRIADVGCGSGQLLRSLRQLGFSQLTGIDPNIAADVQIDAHLRIQKAELQQVTDRFDLIMFHHSLEHIADQAAVLDAAHSRLTDDGRCLIRIPLASSHAWKTYGLDWAQLDAPRHFYLHSVDSMKLLAGRCGFVVEQVVHDSNDFQFWGSESLARGWPLVDLQTGSAPPQVTALARRHRYRWRRKARDLNRVGQGDQAIFVLRKADATHAATA